MIPIVSYQIGDYEVSRDEWNLTCENTATLSAACRGEGLAFSGTKITLARRLIKHGMTHQQVVEQYGWRARQARARGDQ